MEERDIVSAERVGPRVVSINAAGPEPRPRPLVVRLARRKLPKRVTVIAYFSARVCAAAQHQLT